MGLLSGSASITRFNVLSRPEEPDFDAAAFHEITPGSSVRERIGFLPFEPGAPYQVGQHRWAFRVRLDRVRPDATAVSERLKVLLKAERDATGAPGVGAGRRKKLREQAEEEVLARTSPRLKVVECCLDGETLYAGTTSNALLGRIAALLAEIDVACELKTPWGDRGDAPVTSELVDASGPGQSVMGCRFLAALLEDGEVMVEPESGSARLMSHDAAVSLRGVVLPDLLRYVEQGAEILAAKLLTEETSFRLDGLGFRIGGLRLDSERHDTWIETLDERLERIAAVWDLLDRKFAAVAPRLGEGGE